jgi:hypothetical protein
MEEALCRGPDPECPLVQVAVFEKKLQMEGLLVREKGGRVGRVDGMPSVKITGFQTTHSSGVPCCSSSESMFPIAY